MTCIKLPPIPNLMVSLPDYLVLEQTFLYCSNALENAKGESKKGKEKIRLFILSSRRGKWALLAGTTAIYGLASLQLYITAAVLLPCSLPVGAFWTYVLLGRYELPRPSSLRSGFLQSDQ